MKNNIDLSEEALRRREGILRTVQAKYPDYFKSPESIEAEISYIREYFNQTEPGKNYNPEYIEKLENEIARLQEKNAEYISKEDEEKFEFYKVDFDELEKMGMEVENVEQAKEYFNKIQSLYKNVLDEKDIQRVSKFEDNALNKLSKLQAKEKKPETQMVKKSKYSSIYEKAKGKIQEMFTKMKSFVQPKEQSKENDKEMDEK